MRLAEDRFYNKYPCVMITGKGQPDVATRMFVRQLKETLRIPVLALVDSDSYGVNILSVYMHGSQNMAYDSSNLTTPDIKWLGVRPSDLDRLQIPEQCRLPMTDKDISHCKSLLKESWLLSKPEWKKEVELMLATGVKAEIQALSSFGFQYLTEVYLPLKLQTGYGRRYGRLVLLRLHVFFLSEMLPRPFTPHTDIRRNSELDDCPHAPSRALPFKTENESHPQQ